MESIGAPEKGQDYSAKGRKALSAKIVGEEVTLRVTGKDKYRRTLGTLYLGRDDINLWLVREGWAWQLQKALEVQSPCSGGNRGEGEPQRSVVRKRPDVPLGVPRAAEEERCGKGHAKKRTGGAIARPGKAGRADSAGDRKRDGLEGNKKPSAASKPSPP